MTFLKTITQRLFGRTVIDSLDLNQNAWYIDEEQVTATAAQINTATATTMVGMERIITGTIDFGVAVAVDQDLGVVGFKGTVLGAFIRFSEATDEDVTLSISKAAAAATKITGDYALAALSTTYPNVVGAVVGVGPSATPTFVATDHIYLYAPAQVAARTTGIAHVTIICRITA